MKTKSLNVSQKAVLTSMSCEDDIGEVINLVRSGKFSKNVLVELLSERHPIYEARPNYQMILIRGYAMASFANIGLPNSVLHFVLEELQNGKHPYMVAAAARALRGAKHPGSQFVRFLLQALINIRYHDDSMNLDIFKPTWPLKDPTTAKKEIFLTFQWLQGYAKGALPELRSFLKNTYDFDPKIREEIQKTINTIEKDDRGLDLNCCQIEGRAGKGLSWLWRACRNIKSIGHLKVENESGVSMPLKEIVEGRPTVVAFFYTRCMNPNKCTLTINKLGWLQQELIKTGTETKVNLLAFTYDPSYDTPSKMHVFGENRGLVFGSNVQMLRTSPEDFSLLSEFFELGVNHVASTVNQHRLELFILDPNGNIETSYIRLQWEVKNVLRDIKGLLEKSWRFGWLSTVTSSIRQIGFPILLAFFPKCPMCWAVYLSAFGVPGLQSIPYSPWLIPFIILAIVINLIILYRIARVRNGLTPFWLSLIGGLLVIFPGYLFYNKNCSLIGIIFITMSAILNSLSYQRLIRTSNPFYSTFKDFKRRLPLPKFLFGTKNI